MQQNPRTDSEPTANDADKTAVFGPFTLNLQTGELRKFSAKVRLQNKPFQILKALLEHPGSVVTREELRSRLWPEDTFVDFESGLNTAANRLRLALTDSADHPRYVETLPRIGYRFIAEVRLLEANHGSREGIGSVSQLVTVTDAPEPATLAQTNTGVVSPDSGLHRRMPALHHLADARRWLPSAVLLLLAAILTSLLAIVGARLFQRPASPMFHQLTFRSGLVDNARFTASGEVVYSAGREWDGAQLFLMDVGSPESRKLDFGSGSLASVSKTSDVAFLRHTSTDEYGPELVRVALHGGAPRVVERSVLEADWAADGTLCLVRRDAKGLTVEYPAGVSIYKTALVVDNPRISPDGQKVALVEHPLQGDDAGSVVLLERNGKARHLTDNWASIKGVAWSANGKEVWFAAAKQGIDRELYAVNLKGQIRKVATMPAVLELFDIAPSGRVLIGRSVSRLSLFVGDLKSLQVKDRSWLDWSHLVAISADGNKILFDESGEGGGPLYTVYLHRKDRGTTERIANGRALDLSPDGSSILIGNHAPSSQITLVSVDGVQTAKTLSAPGHVYQSAHFAGDGKNLVVQLSCGTSPQELFLQNIETGVLRKVPTADSLKSVLVSADGSRMASVVSSHKSVVIDLQTGRSLSIDNKYQAVPVGWTSDNQLILAELNRDKVGLEEVSVPGMQRHALGKLPPALVNQEELMHVLVSRDLSTFAFSQPERVISVFAVDGWS